MSRFDHLNRSNHNMKSLGERIARETGTYPEIRSGWDIPFKVFYTNRSRAGFLIANHQRNITGVPFQFLVYWESLYRGVMRYRNGGWDMENSIQEPDFVQALGQWIVIYYQ